MILAQRTRSILPPCPIHGMWGERHLEMAKPTKRKEKKEFKINERGQS